MRLRPMRGEDVAFVYECLAELRGDVRCSEQAFRAYAEDAGLLGRGEFQILVGWDGEVPVGMLTCNRFAMPRYLGYGYELEEVIVHPRHQGRGFATPMVTAFLDSVSARANVRRVIVKTDDRGRAAHIYSKLFEASAMRVYIRRMNKL